MFARKLQNALPEIAAWSALPLAVLGLLMPAAAQTPRAHDGAWPKSALAVPRSAEPHAAAALSPQARQLVEWISLTADHAGAPFVVVDKQRARVLVFGADARLLAHSPVLLGAALGDDSVPGIGARPMAQIQPFERTTPAGRFVAERGRNMQGEDIVWVDYDAAVSMHRVRTANRVEQRARRLATPTIADNRISYGCINVPAQFYDGFIKPIFALRTAPVYVLPDMKPMQEVFGMPGKTVVSVKR